MVRCGEVSSDERTRMRRESPVATPWRGRRPRWSGERVPHDQRWQLATLWAYALTASSLDRADDSDDAPSRGHLYVGGARRMVDRRAQREARTADRGYPSRVDTPDRRRDRNCCPGTTGVDLARGERACAQDSCRARRSREAGTVAGGDIEPLHLNRIETPRVGPRESGVECEATAW